MRDAPPTRSPDLKAPALVVEERQGRPVVVERWSVQGLGLVESFSYPSGRSVTLLNGRRVPPGDAQGARP